MQDNRRKDIPYWLATLKIFVFQIAVCILTQTLYTDLISTVVYPCVSCTVFVCVSRACTVLLYLLRVLRLTLVGLLKSAQEVDQLLLLEAAMIVALETGLKNEATTYTSSFALVVSHLVAFPNPPPIPLAVQTAFRSAFKRSAYVPPASRKLCAKRNATSSPFVRLSAGRRSWPGGIL